MPLLSGRRWGQETAGEVVVSPESGEAYRSGLDLFNSNRFADAITKFEEAYSLDDRNINALFATRIFAFKAGAKQ